MSPKPGEVYLLDLGTVGKVRPVIVVSRDDPDAPRAICICVPITSQGRGSRYEVSIGRPKFLREPESWANAQSVFAVGNEKLGRFLGRISAEQLGGIKTALRYALDI